ncbi:MAG TPA: prepilin-type N-terminal cleavage/methylation domain-containing protein [Pyrinomonadaceae bacterium]|nr:prepilin-type N-terminal cleavage/methylation domain-containing protein [Pyrinomonadaceae bacterium]
MTEKTLQEKAFTNEDLPRRISAIGGSSRGHSIIEMLIVVALIGVLSSLTLPQFIAQRRLTRSIGLSREILSQLRQTRQLAMSQRQAFTFRYDNAAKQISIIDHNSNPGGSLLVDPSYPNTAGSVVVSSTPLAEAAISSEINYGIPSGLPNGALSDGIALTPLFNNQFTVTFQPDGSVIDGAGDPQGRAIFFFNNRAAPETASAISIMGASGRVKIWRYNAGANLYTE